MVILKLSKLGIIVDTFKVSSMAKIIPPPPPPPPPNAEKQFG